MKSGQFCFLTDQYFLDFPDSNLMQNKESVGGTSHDRPCFFAFHDVQQPEILWLIPISSRVDKYSHIYNAKVEKHGYCDTIFFGIVAGEKRAFLIQNICPATPKYVSSTYLDKNKNPIQIDQRTAETVIQKARSVLSTYFRGGRWAIFPNVQAIKQELIAQLSIEIQKPTLERVPEKKPSIHDRLESAKAQAAAQAAPTQPPHKSGPER